MEGQAGVGKDIGVPGPEPGEHQPDDIEFAIHVVEPDFPASEFAGFLPVVVMSITRSFSRASWTLGSSIMGFLRF